METNGETVGLMLLEGHAGQKLYRHLSCSVMTLNHFLGKSLQACIIIFLRAGSLQSFQNWPNKFKLVCDIEDTVSNVAVDIHLPPPPPQFDTQQLCKKFAVLVRSSVIGPDLFCFFWLQGEPCSIKVFSLSLCLANSITLPVSRPLSL